MSRLENDIPEVFRRAMEEAGWRGDEGDNPPPPRNARPVDPWWTNRWLWLGLLIVLIIASFSWIVTTYTEWLWYSAQDYQNVWLKSWGAQVITFLVFFVIAAVVLLTNWRLARRRALRPAAGVQLLNMPGIRWILVAIGLFLAFILGQAAASRWDMFLRYFYRVPFGTADPIFNLDLSFYLFELPVYNFIHGWLMPLVVMTLLGTGAIYLVNNLPALQQGGLQLRTLPDTMRSHMALLLVAFFLLWAVGYWFDAYDILYSPGGVVFGAGYTDINASLPILRLQLVLMLLVALAVAYFAFRPNLRPALIAGALWLVASIALAGVYPGLLQRYRVEPNELAYESPFISNNINYTRLGFGLQDIESQQFIPSEEMTEQDLEDNAVALDNVRLWDYRPLLQTYRQLQELRSYYQFFDVDIDRYEVDGQPRQVMLSARELNKAGLSNPTWVNQKLEYTHGFGLVMNPVDQISSQGRPIFYIQDLPPESTIDINVERPQLYYGELTNDVVYAGSQLEEFDYPSGDENVYTHYEGRGGVPLQSFINRLAFAFRFGETNLVLSEYVDEETRVMMHRQIQQRVQHIAPFLVQDGDPYIVVDGNGNLVWMLDTYTISDMMPYSQPYVRPAVVGEESTYATMNVPNGINYIRNSVKVTIDAYDGTVTFYVTDPNDPLIQSYARAFPDLFQPFEAMPDVLERHIRYPVDLFLIQAQQYLTYHMVDVQVFYNEEDLWQIPNEIFDDATVPIEPYYVTFPLPGEDESEFLLIQPYTPNNRNNMIAWIAARNDPPNYGELFAFEMPKQELVFGPIQVEGRIDQEPAISEQFALWNQQGSRVIRGNLIVIPINDTFLYIEPVYLRSDTSAIPELRRVIAASGENVVMRETLDDALAALILEEEAVDELVVEPPVETPDAEAEATPPAEEPAPTEPPVAGDATVEDLIESANAHFEAAQEAQRNGDWATYGSELEALQADLERLMELTGEASVP
jgi:uncharacterized membrane protein (UPF0182 family)